MGGPLNPWRARCRSIDTSSFELDPFHLASILGSAARAEEEGQAHISIPALAPHKPSFIYRHRISKLRQIHSLQILALPKTKPALQETAENLTVCSLIAFFYRGLIVNPATCRQTVQGDGLGLSGCVRALALPLPFSHQNIYANALGQFSHVNHLSLERIAFIMKYKHPEFKLHLTQLTCTTLQHHNTTLYRFGCPQLL